MMDNIYCKRVSGGIVSVDVVYSPDDRGYYLDKFIISSSDIASDYYSKVNYPNRQAAVMAFSKGKVIWIKR